MSDTVLSFWNSSWTWWIIAIVAVARPIAPHARKLIAGWTGRSRD